MHPTWQYKDKVQEPLITGKTNNRHNLTKADKIVGTTRNQVKITGNIPVLF